MKKLIVIVLVALVAVLASGCTDELVHEECNPRATWFCYASASERPYVRVQGVLVPLVADERFVGSWAVEGDDGPYYVIRANNTIKRFAPLRALIDGQVYEEGKWVYFGGFGILARYESGYSHILEFDDFSADGESTHVTEIRGGERIVEGTLYRYAEYTGEIL